jgi:acyl-homoserine lactone acylase PvdQ
MDLTAPGTKLHLATAPGAPVNANGYNEHVAWGVTSGLSDEDDLFVVRLAGKERYRYKGKVRKMTCRTERFRFTKDGKVKSVRKRLCRTVHGPVQSRSGTYAFTRRYAIWNRELETLSGLALLGESKNLQEVDRALRKVTWNENILAADDQGNIGYWHPGLHPLRHRGWDERLPMPGDGRANWRGLLPRTKTPHVINPPSRNWLVNWNNTPSVGWTQGDSPAHERLNGSYHRIAMMEEAVKAAAADPSSFERGTIDILRRTGTIATQRPTADRILRQAAEGATGPAKALLDTLVAWDGNYTRTADDGTVDPGVATWEAFKAAAQVVALGAPTEATRGLLGTPGSKGVIEATLGETVALRTLDPEGLRRAATAAAEVLTETYGSADPARWRAKGTMVSAQVQGLAIPPQIPMQNRGTYDMAVELGG